eukprot:12577177-Alexandrium_andersonii.AAC.1
MDINPSVSCSTSQQATTRSHMPECHEPGVRGLQQLQELVRKWELRQRVNSTVCNAKCGIVA